MKNFNIEKALAGHPVVTRDGRKAEDFKKFKGLNNVYAVLEGQIFSWSVDGLYFNRSHPELDLFMAEEEYYLVVTNSELFVRSLDLRLSQTLHRYPVNNPSATCFKLVKVENHEK